VVHRPSPGLCRSDLPLVGLLEGPEVECCHGAGNDMHGVADGTWLSSLEGIVEKFPAFSIRDDLPEKVRTVPGIELSVLEILFLVPAGKATRIFYQEGRFLDQRGGSQGIHGEATRRDGQGGGPDRLEFIAQG